MSNPDISVARFELIERRIAEISLTVSLLKSELERLRVYRHYFKEAEAARAEAHLRTGPRCGGHLGN